MTESKQNMVDLKGKLLDMQYDALYCCFCSVLARVLLIEL